MTVGMAVAAEDLLIVASMSVLKGADPLLLVAPKAVGGLSVIAALLEA